MYSQPPNELGLSLAFAEPARLNTSSSRVPELSERVNLLCDLLDRVTDAVVFVDLEGNIQIANSAAAALVQRKLEQRLFWDCFQDDYFGFSLREDLRYGMSRQRLYKSDPKLGLEMEVSTSFYHGKEARYRGLLLIFRNIKDRQELQQAAARFDRMKELGEMATQMAHEVRNPLGGIRGFAMLLFKDLETQPHLQEMVGQIIESARSLERLMTHVLQYARPVAILPQTLDVAAFLKKIGKFIKMDPAFPPHIHLALHIPNEVILAPLDAEAMKGALLNLLVNGWQAMPNGGRLTLSLLQSVTRYSIEVTDSGVGMEPKQLAALFSPFYTTKQGGNGLGLAEVKKIVEAHQGTIEVRSSVGRGTTFTLTLPRRRG
jgi:signal transduction histidine kinase